MHWNKGSAFVICHQCANKAYHDCCIEFEDSIIKKCLSILECSIKPCTLALVGKKKGLHGSFTKSEKMDKEKNLEKTRWNINHRWKGKLTFSCYLWLQKSDMFKLKSRTIDSNTSPNNLCYSDKCWKIVRNGRQVRWFQECPSRESQKTCALFVSKQFYMKCYEMIKDVFFGKDVLRLLILKQHSKWICK